MSYIIFSIYKRKIIRRIPNHKNQSIRKTSKRNKAIWIEKPQQIPHTYVSADSNWIRTFPHNYFHIYNPKHIYIPELKNTTHAIRQVLNHWAKTHYIVAYDGVG